jgi:hypothetical protein
MSKIWFTSGTRFECCKKTQLVVIIKRKFEVGYLLRMPRSIPPPPPPPPPRPHFWLVATWHSARRGVVQMSANAADWACFFVHFLPFYYSFTCPFKAHEEKRQSRRWRQAAAAGVVVLCRRSAAAARLIRWCHHIRIFFRGRQCCGAPFIPLPLPHSLGVGLSKRGVRPSCGDVSQTGQRFSTRILIYL